jgi:hypothetical protein
MPYLKITCFTLVCIWLSIHYAFAETCPTPSELREGNYHQWILLDINNAFPLSDDSRYHFQEQVVGFQLAEWEASAPEGEAHCYYHGSENDPLYLDAFLAKTDLKPMDTKWEILNEDVQQCRQDLTSCVFEAT